jgi:hypothetical protein
MHARAKLTPFGRLLLVDRVLAQGWSAAHAADALGVSRAASRLMLRGAGCKMNAS